MKVYLSRWICTETGENLLRLAEESKRAAKGGAELVIFPESFLHGYKRTIEAAVVRKAFAEVSSAHPATVFLFGSFSEKRRNRMTVWRAGKEIAHYDKVHLFEPNGELDLWNPGENYAAVDVGPFRMGLINCNDLRFPEQARALRLEADCNVFAIVAWWPWRRDHVWRILLRARAIENGAWVLGCCVAASLYLGENFAGAGNYVFDPFGALVRTVDDNNYELDVGKKPELVVDPVASYREVKEVKIF